MYCWLNHSSFKNYSDTINPHRGISARMSQANLSCYHSSRYNHLQRLRLHALQANRTHHCLQLLPPIDILFLFASLCSERDPTKCFIPQLIYSYLICSWLVQRSLLAYYSSIPVSKCRHGRLRIVFRFSCHHHHFLMNL